jgi:class 3 adenylate cyclase
LTAISFEKHLPRTFLALIGQHPASEPFTVALPAAVMMTDISGFSALAIESTREGAHGVEALQSVLDRYFGALGAVVARFGGDIAAFAGDAVLALWPSGDDAAAAAAAAVQCALAIQAEAPGWAGDRPAGLTQRIAVAQGELRVCKLGGAGGKWLYLYAGAPVFEAGRACDLTPPGQVHVTPGVAALLGGRLDGEPAAEGCARARRVLGPLPPLLPFSRPLPSSSPSTQSPDPAPPAIAQDRLAPYVPEVLVRRAMAGQGEWLAELRRVTVMFVKLEEAAFGREVDPARLQSVTHAVQQAVQRFGGALPYVQMDDKGLNFIVAWGVPTAAFEDDAARALIAGLAIQAAVRTLGLQPSLGVATGILFCGECGAAQRRQYSMIGPAINLAARLAAAAPDDLLADEPTTKAAGDRLSFTIAQNVRPKAGESTILAFRPEPRHQPAPDERRAALVGRQAELAALVHALQAGRDGEGARLLVVGEPGIGKSRLLQALRKAVEGAGLAVIGGEAQSIERKTPYFLWREVLRGLLGRLALPGESGRQAVCRHLQDDPALLAWAPLLDDVLPLAQPETDLTREMRGTARALALQSLLVHLAGRASAGAPLVLLVDDLHWVDALSGTALVALANRVPALSIVAGTRALAGQDNAAAEAFSRLPAVRRTELGALDEAQAAEMVGRLLGVEAVPPELSGLIQARCGGNPFYIQQLTLALREGGHVELLGGRCKLQPDIALRVAQSMPGTLRGVITSRVDRLGEEEQLLLKVASVLGRVFTARALGAVLPSPQPAGTVAAQLSGLAGSSLVASAGGAADGAAGGAAGGAPGGAPGDEYAFSHVLVQEAIYELLPMSQRRRQHQRIADWLEAQHGDGLAGHFGLLANHCMLAEEFPRALGHLEGGARTAIRNAAHHEAIQYLESAQRITEERRLDADALRRARWHSQLGDCRHELSALTQARQEYLCALELLGRPYAPSAAARTAGIVGHLARRALGRAPGAVVAPPDSLSPSPSPSPSPSAASSSASSASASASASASSAASEAARAQLASHAYAQLSEIAYYENDPIAVLHLTLLSAHEARRCASVPEMSAAEGALAIAFGQMGLAAVGRRHAARAIALAESRPTESQGIAYAHLLAMVFATSQCDWARLDASAPLAETLYGGLGERFRVAAVHGMRLTAATQRGNYADASALLADMAAAAGPDTPPRVHGWRHAGALQLGITTGRIDPADIEGAERALQGSEMPIDRLMALGSLASALLRLGEPARALAAAREGLELLLGRTPVAGAGFIYGPLGVVEALLACWELVPAAERGAHGALVEQACAKLRLYTRQVPSTRARGLYLLACHAERSGRRRQAIALWRRSAQAAVRTGMPYDEAAALLALGQRLPAARDEAERAQRICQRLQVPPPGPLPVPMAPAAA